MSKYNQINYNIYGYATLFQMLENLNEGANVAENQKRKSQFIGCILKKLENDLKKATSPGQYQRELTIIEEYLTSLVNDFPNSPGLLCHKIKFYRITNNADEVRKHQERLLLIAPGNRVKCELANSLIKSVKYTDRANPKSIASINRANKLIDEVLLSDSDNTQASHAYNAKAKIAYYLGRFYEAGEAYWQIIKINNMKINNIKKQPKKNSEDLDKIREFQKEISYAYVYYIHMQIILYKKESDLAIKARILDEVEEMTRERWRIEPFNLHILDLLITVTSLRGYTDEQMRLLAIREKRDPDCQVKKFFDDDSEILDGNSPNPEEDLTTKGSVWSASVELVTQTPSTSVLASPTYLEELKRQFIEAYNTKNHLKMINVLNEIKNAKVDDNDKEGKKIIAHATQLLNYGYSTRDTRLYNKEARILAKHISSVGK